MAGSTDEQVRITSDDVGPVLAIITWFTMTMMIIAVLSRIAIKLTFKRCLKFDDYTMCIALAFGVAQCIAVSMSLSYGLGKRIQFLDTRQRESIRKIDYAADVLFMIAFGMAKLTVLLLLQSLVQSRLHKMIASISIYVSLAWMLVSSFVLAFKCGLPHPWATNSGHCINEFALWAAIAPVDIITELAIIALPALLVWPLQLALSKKMAVVLAFAFRASVLIVIPIRLVFLHKYHSSSTTDFSFDSIPFRITTQILMSISITSACIPALKPFLDSFDSGLLNVKLKSVAAQSHSGVSGLSYELYSRRRNTLTITAPDQDQIPQTNYSAAITSHKQRKHQSIESLGSGKSDEMIIKRTHQWTVEHDSTQQEQGSWLENSGER